MWLDKPRECADKNREVILILQENHSHDQGAEDCLRREFYFQYLLSKWFFGSVQVRSTYASMLFSLWRNQCVSYQTIDF